MSIMSTYDRHKRSRSVEEMLAQRKCARTAAALFRVPPYSPPNDRCAICHEQEPAEFVICDGCDTDYHLACAQVSEDDDHTFWFCRRCTGNRPQLQAYLEQHASWQESLRSHDAMMSYLRRVVHKREGERPSELTRHPAADWVGKPLRLEVPGDEKASYHFGRILGYRISNKVDQKPDESIHEYLVRFQDHRSSHRAWLILEQHKLAIGVEFGWADQTPVQRWLRSALSVPDELPLVLKLTDKSFISPRGTWTPWGSRLLKTLQEKYYDSMVKAELAHQASVVHWANLPDRLPPPHPLKFSSADPDCLPVLGADDFSRDCPLLYRGLDRCKLLSDEATQRRAVTLQCVRVPVNVSTFLQERERRQRAKELQET